MTVPSDARPDKVPAIRRPGPSREPFDVPCVLTGKAQWMWPMGVLFLAACALGAVLSTFFGNHQPIGWKLITGVSTETVVFLALACGGLYAFRHFPSLELTSDSVIIHGRVRSRSVPWKDVENVFLKLASGEGVTLVVPAIKDRSGRVLRIGALAEFSFRRQRASEAVERLLATRDQQLAAPDREVRAPR